MIKQRNIAIKTADITLTYAEMGDIVCNSASAITITLPTPSSGLWYRVSNAGAGVVTIYYGSTLTALNQYEQVLLLSNGSTSWWMSKGGAAAANGLPIGGTAGQVLSKIDGMDFNAQWTNVAGVVSYTNPIDIPPTTPSTFDDEFNGSSLGSKWGRILSANGTFALSSGALTFAYTNSGSDNGSAILQAISGDFTAIASVKECLSMGNATTFGIALAASIGDTTALVEFGIHTESTLSIYAQRWNSITSWNANLGTVDLLARKAYLKAKRLGTTISLYYSLGGSSWALLYTGTQPFTITAIGLIGTSKNGLTSIGSFDWFRVTQP